MTHHTSEDIFCSFDWRSKFLLHTGTDIQKLFTALLHHVLTTRYACAFLSFVPYVWLYYIMCNHFRHYTHHQYSCRYWQDCIIAPLTPCNWRACWRHILALTAVGTYLYLLYVGKSILHHSAARTALFSIVPHVTASGSFRRAL